MSGISEAVRAWAKGSCPLEAGVELLIAHGRAIDDGAPWLIALNDKEPGTSGRPSQVMVDVDELVGGTGAWSGGEQRIVAVAASLLSPERPVNLNDALPGLDRAGLELVLAALAHASGSHEHSGVVTDELGVMVGFERLNSLYPWPPAATSRLPSTGHGPGL